MARLAQDTAGEAERSIVLASRGLMYIRVLQVKTMKWPGGEGFDFMGFEVSSEARVVFSPPVKPSALMPTQIVKIWRIGFGWLVIVALIAPIWHAGRIIRRRLEPPDPSRLTPAGP
jgi:hypothetical protein